MRKVVLANTATLLVMLVAANGVCADGRLQLLGGDVPAVAANGTGGAAATLPLQLTEDNDADTVLVHGWRRFYWGHRPYYYHGYRPYYYWGYRPYYYWGYRPYYWPYYPRFYFSFGYPRYYYYYYYPPTYYYYPPPPYYYYYYYPISMNGDSGSEVPSTIQRVEPQRFYGDAYGTTVPPTAPNQATYPYDGGPRSPVPMPRNGNDTKPRPETRPAQPTVPLEGTPIAYPTPVTQKKYVYPGYGERPAPASNFAPERTVSKQN